MADLPQRAVELVASERARDPHVIELARLLSIASQIEPELIRAMRLTVLPGSDASLESDLWFSALIQARDPDGISFLADVADVLRRELAEPANASLLDEARNVIASRHANHSPMLVLEESATYLGLASDAGAYALMQRELGRLLAALESSTDDGIARWVARTLPRMPESVRTSDPALALARHTSRRLGGIKVRGVIEAGPADAAWHPQLFASLPKVPILVHLRANGLELGAAAVTTAASVDVPQTDPLAVEVGTPSAEGWHSQRVTWTPGTAVTIDIAVGPAVRIATLAGHERTFRVDVLGRPPVLYVAGAGELALISSREAEELGWTVVTTLDDVRYRDDLPVLDAYVLGSRTTLADVIERRRRWNLFKQVPAGYVITERGLHRITDEDIGPSFREYMPLEADAGAMRSHVFQRVESPSEVNASAFRMALRRTLVDLDIERARGWLERQTAQSKEDAAPPLSDIESSVDAPFPGLRPFRTSEAPIFFARAAEVEAALKILSRTRALVIVGPSECGKTSFLLAGVVPALQRGFLSRSEETWDVAVMRPGLDPMRNLAEALRPLLSASDLSPDDLRDLIQRHPGGIGELIGQSLLPRDTTLLLIVDAFEEIFRQHEGAAREGIERFVEFLVNSINTSAMFCAFSLRSDFSSEAFAFPPFRAMAESRLDLASPGREALREAIVGPLRVFGGGMAPGVVDLFMGALREQELVLPLLQHTMSRLWTLSSGQDATALVHITRAQYESIGGVPYALDFQAEALFSRLHEEGKQATEKMFRRLTISGVRTPASIAEIAENADIEAARIVRAAEPFRAGGCQFLTPPEGVPLDSDTVLDISSELVIRQWKRLREWIKAESESADLYRGLAQKAATWERGVEDIVWTPGDARTAEDWKQRQRPTAAWAEQYGGRFDATIRFLDAMQRAPGSRSSEGGEFD